MDRWWTPADTRQKKADPPIDGVMLWQGDIADRERGGARRIFLVRETRTRIVWGVSERDGLVELRRVPPGAKVWISCLGRKETGNTIAGEKQTRLEFEVVADRLLDRPIVSAAPVTVTPPSSAPAGLDDVPPPSDEDIPF